MYVFLKIHYGSSRVSTPSLARNSETARLSLCCGGVTFRKASMSPTAGMNSGMNGWST